ncbi:hypothetical protein JL721_9367 [Aureococcus anophagefferens]|nr:hypothetical protein JL721_9367 [Aureococcus anophagefferens]
MPRSQSMRSLSALVVLAASAVAINRGGASGATYGALRGGLDSVAALRAHVDGGACVPGLGAKAEAICAAAADAVAELGGDAKAAAAVEAALDGQLKALSRSSCGFSSASLQTFRPGGSDASAAEYAGMVAAGDFCREADAATRPGWSYDAELKELGRRFEASRRRPAAGDGVIKAAQTRANCFTVLKKLAFELDAATAGRLGTDAPWDAGVAWRVPDTNVNLSGALQRGKSSLIIPSPTTEPRAQLQQAQRKRGRPRGSYKTEVGW